MEPGATIAACPLAVQAGAMIAFAVALVAALGRGWGAETRRAEERGIFQRAS